MFLMKSVLGNTPEEEDYLITKTSVLTTCVFLVCAGKSNTGVRS